MSLYKIGSNIIRASGGGGMFRQSSGGSGFTFDSGWTGSGTFADGQDVTLTRGAGGIGARTDERPLRWIPGDADMALDSTFSRDSSSLPSAQTNASWQSSVKPYSAAGGAITQLYPIPAAADESNCYAGDLTDIGTAGKAYWNYWIRNTWNGASVGVNNKMARIWNVGQTASALFANASFSQAADIDGDAGIDGSVSHQIPQPAANTWYNYEHEFQECSGADVQDGIWQTYANGGAAFSDALRWITRHTGQADDSLKRLMHLSQFSNRPPPADGENLYYYGIYLTDTRLRVFISDESTFTTTVYSGGSILTHYREIQLPKATGNSDTTLSIRLRAGTYSGSLSGKYLWAVFSDGTRSRVGQFT